MESLYFGLDPLFWVHVKIFIKDILKLEEIEYYKNLYKFEGHLIRNVSICGIIVGVEQTYTATIYTIDDSTGTIPCVLHQNSVIREDTLHLGTCIQLNGIITKYRYIRQINIHDINLITDPNKELLHYLQAIYLKKSHYNELFRPPQRIIENAEAIKNEINKKNETDTDIVTLSQDFNHIRNRNQYQRFALQYIKDTYGEDPFELKHLLQNELLNQLAKKIIKQEKSDNQITKDQIHQFIAEIVNQLDIDGELINIDNNNTIYQTDNDFQLKQTIENIIRETIELNTSKYSSFDLSGVQKNFIQIKTREILPLQPISKIDECLNKMVENSIIYLTGPYEYRLLE